MQSRAYPLVYFELSKNATLGILVGSRLEVVQKDIKTIKSFLRDHLQRDYKRYGYYPQINLTNAKLKTVEVPFRPIYRLEESSYPMKNTVLIPVAYLYGELADSTGYECYLPLFGQSFYYNEEEQFPSLISHYIDGHLKNITPEQIYQYMRYPKPKLDFINLRIKEDKQFNWTGWNMQKRSRGLNRLAVQVPEKKGGRKNILPEMVWEREEEIKTLVDKLLTSQASVLVVGESGAGKSAVIQQAVKRIVNKLKNAEVETTFWRISPQRITASAKYLGEWEQAVEELVDNLEAVNGILWVDQIIQLLMSGGEGPEDSIAAFLLNSMKDNQVHLLGEVTPQELESIKRLLPEFLEQFQIVQLNVLSEQQIQNILKGFADYSKERLKVLIEPQSLTEIYRLLLRYFPYEAFPGKGIKFLSKCINYCQLNNLDSLRQQQVLELFIQQSGLPPIFLDLDMKLEEKEIKAYFRSQIIGQEEVIDKIYNIINIYKASINDPKKPIATMLFAGPTGVGKTASAEVLAKYFFGQGQKKTPLIRIDMSEFQHPNQVIRFTGFGKEPGQLVKLVREHPFAVVLLDEVEKAHPIIFDALLTVLDEGILIDHFGRITNFRNTIIIMTTNLGASQQQAVGFKTTELASAKYNAAIYQFFRPEFVNRIDEIIFFRALTVEDIQKILHKELQSLKQREGFVKQHLELVFQLRLVAHLAKVGIDTKYGARPLQRAIEQTITAPMAAWLIENRTISHKKIVLDFDERLLIQMM
jgi:ATP-dependent Clp protease ATP-binding subunit ClpA